MTTTFSIMCPPSVPTVNCLCLESQTHTGQCKRIGGCYNELVVAFLRTGDGLKDKKSIPVDFMINL